MSEVNLKALLESGAHFGHQTRRWNPKMGRYIYGVRGGVHIIDLTMTAGLLEAALKFVEETTASGGTILFVGTKRQAKAAVKSSAIRAGQPYVTERWLGGMITNWRTIHGQITRLRKLDADIESGDVAAKYNKKEASVMAMEAEKLQHVFGGIRDLNRPPQALFVVDVPREDIAVAEAIKLGIPVVAITDTNADPDLIDYPIPANDDAIRAVALITDMIADAALKGAASHSAKAKQDETDKE
jgi:small subunit ribosomal protein S2